MLHCASFEDHPLGSLDVVGEFEVPDLGGLFGPPSMGSSSLGRDITIGFNECADLTTAGRTKFDASQSVLHSLLWDLVILPSFARLPGRA